jgi:hypothetical protein
LSSENGSTGYGLLNRHHAAILQNAGETGHSGSQAHIADSGNAVIVTIMPIAVTNHDFQQRETSPSPFVS